MKKTLIAIIFILFTPIAAIARPQHLLRNMPVCSEQFSLAKGIFALVDHKDILINAGIRNPQIGLHYCSHTVDRGLIDGVLILYPAYLHQDVPSETEIVRVLNKHDINHRLVNFAETHE